LRLQEWNTEIDNEITRLQQDWILNQKIITELQKEDKSSLEEDDNLSIDYVQVENVIERKQKPQKTKKRISNKKAERKEGLEKARAWHLDRIRAKRK
jgi:hypothetical protein